MAFATDALLVLWLEFTRAAVEKSVGLGDRALPGPLLAFHILVSTSVILFFVHQFVTGRRLLRNDQAVRARHRAAGATILLLRFISMTTSFWVVE